MPSSNKFPVILLFAMVAVVAAAGGLWLAGATQSGAAPAKPGAPVDQAQLRDGPFLRLPETKQLTDFELYGAGGEPFSRASLEGHYTLAFFGFTSCPHICPNTMFKLTEVAKSLENEVPEDKVPQVLLIAVDPGRDTPEALEEYEARFDHALRAVSGEDAQLRALTMQLGAHYVVPEHEPDAWYNVDHSLGVVLLDPQARWVGLFSAPHDAEAMAGALARYLQSASAAYGGG